MTEDEGGVTKVEPAPISLELLTSLCIRAASEKAGFNEHYDFAGQVGPEPVLKLIIQVEEILATIDDVILSCAMDPQAVSKLTAASERVRKSWPKQTVDPVPFPR